MAERILLNSKTRGPACATRPRPAGRRAVAASACRLLTGALRDAGVTVHDNPSEDDLRAEFLSMDMAVAVVDDLDAAIAHVNTGTSHTEAIVTGIWLRRNGSPSGSTPAAVMVNAADRVHRRRAVRFRRRNRHLHPEVACARADGPARNSPRPSGSSGETATWPPNIHLFSTPATMCSDLRRQR